jgi:hypothetical protein
MWMLLFACGGSAPPPWPAFDVDGDGSLSFVDCDDQNAGIYPGAREVYYDGRDANCDGADDYDQDGDGYAWDVHGGEDCDDLDPEVNPDGVEVPYDGVDNDCDPSTSEADLDGDGSRHPADCDDADPASYPGAPERMGDGVDQDCGGDADGAPLGTWPDLLTFPRSLRAATFEGRPAIAFAVDRLDGPNPYAPDLPDPMQPSLFQVGVAILDPLSAEPETLVFHGANHVDFAQADIPTAVDVVGADDALWFGLGFTAWRSGDPRAFLVPYVRFGGAMVRQNGPSRILDSAVGDLDHIDVQLDGDDDALLCAGSEGGLTVFSGALGSTDGGLGGTATANAAGGAVVTPDGDAWSCDADGECQRWVLPLDGVPFDPAPLPGVSNILREHGGLWLVQDDAFGVRVEGVPVPLELFSGQDVKHADATRLVRTNGDPWIVAAAVIEAGFPDQVVLAFGPEDAGLLTTAFLRPPDTSTPTDVAVWADAESLFVAVLAQDFAGTDRLWLASYPWAD